MTMYIHVGKKEFNVYSLTEKDRQYLKKYFLKVLSTEADKLENTPLRILENKDLKKNYRVILAKIFRIFETFFPHVRYRGSREDPTAPQIFDLCGLRVEFKSSGNPMVSYGEVKVYHSDKLVFSNYMTETVHFGHRYKVTKFIDGDWHKILDKIWTQKCSELRKSTAEMALRWLGGTIAWRVFTEEMEEHLNNLKNKQRS